MKVKLLKNIYKTATDILEFKGGLQSVKIFYIHQSYLYLKVQDIKYRGWGGGGGGGVNQYCKIVVLSERRVHCADTGISIFLKSLLL